MAGPTYVDDPGILDDAQLWRRVCPAWIILDENHGGVRVSSQAFHDSSDGTPMSVLISDLVRQTGRDENDVIASFPGYCLASFTAGVARANRQGVAHTPTRDEPAHGSVFGPKTKSIERALARSCEWVIAPPVWG